MMRRRRPRAKTALRRPSPRAADHSEPDGQLTSAWLISRPKPIITCSPRSSAVQLPELACTAPTPTTCLSAYSGDIILSRSTMSGAPQERFSHPICVFLPSVSRRLPWACSCFIPSDIRTCDGSSEPDVHALPDDAQIPCISSSRIIDSPSIPSKDTFTLFGRRLVRWPFSLTSAIFSKIPSISWSRSSMSSGVSHPSSPSRSRQPFPVRR